MSYGFKAVAGNATDGYLAYETGELPTGVFRGHYIQLGTGEVHTESFTLNNVEKDLYIGSYWESTYGTFEVPRASVSYDRVAKTATVSVSWPGGIAYNSSRKLNLIVMEA